MSTLGKLLQLTTFGESHGPAIGGVLSGCPSNIVLDFDYIQHQLDRRKPGQSAIVTQRKELDQVQFLSGIFQGKTTGAPIGFLIPNNDQKSKDYDHLKDVYRPSHADFTYHKKYQHRDYRGGGRASARETANWVVAGGIAKHIIPEISIRSYVSAVGTIRTEKSFQELDLQKIDHSIVRCPDDDIADQMIEYIKQIRKEGDTIGGEITCVVENVPVGLGEPIFDKLHARLAHAMMSINAVKGFEYGVGFDAITKKGSQINDLFLPNMRTKTNFSGGIQGGISNGMPIYFKIAFKPVATLMQVQETIDQNNELTTFIGKGRHDPCVVPRAVPIVDAMTALVLADMTLYNRSQERIN
ncbi:MULTISPECIES: chorismate synthase [Weeksella]|uniref:chorismate synthase n=1 Tax=Weeksella TaxID=1013 RepID=UPI0008A4D4C3|nr:MULTISPECIES: chorismate synthase [Weeksella]MDK7375457.1 chorismate synthase [Weeksella virosa]MDK7675348.1 chorismate synthase [Weeksella virosa]OFM84514.1 chorismate synthase [Weeksella sp. HMSC059D05]